MTLRLMQSGLLLVVTACGAAPSASAAADAPFTTTEVTTFNAPWAMDFLPGSGVRLTGSALVTEKGGKLWLVNASDGAKQGVSGVPAVVAKGQGGLLDVVASPGFAGDQFVYLTYSEPAQNGGSQLALARAKLKK